jgi:hypothetical protein
MGGFVRLEYAMDSGYSPRHFPARIPGSTNVAGMNETFAPAFDQE